jgi:[citrate (pro-3S)-lyase] ligase
LTESGQDQAQGAKPLRSDGPPLPEARALIEACGLRFEPAFDDLVGLYEQGRLVACGARAGYVLKMLAIVPSHQGTDTLGELVTRLILSGIKAGQDTLFVFTPPQNVVSFQSLNFRLLVTHGQAALLEHGPGLPAYLAAHAAEITPGRNGAVVINGNPFTLGHLRLVEYAAQRVDRLYLFVVREERSLVPFAARFRLAQEATAHLDHVTVLDTSRYAVSAGTFPSYFLKRLDALAPAQMQIDLRLFAQRIAPSFHLATRFVGEEPLCPTTAAYNRMMAEVLGEYGIELTVVPRWQVAGQPISASRVRAAYQAGDLEGLADLVPPATLAYLRSAPALRTQMEEP